MTTLEMMTRRTAPRFGVALLTLALAAATVVGYQAALDAAGSAVQATLAGHPAPSSCSAHLAAVRAGTRATC